MNEVCRARVTSSSQANVASLVKTWRSGQNRIRVPVTPFLILLPLCIPDCGLEPGGRPLTGEDSRQAALERHLLRRR